MTSTLVPTISPYLYCLKQGGFSCVCNSNFLKNFLSNFTTNFVSIKQSLGRSVNMTDLLRISSMNSALYSLYLLNQENPGLDPFFSICPWWQPCTCSNGSVIYGSQPLVLIPIEQTDIDKLVKYLQEWNNFISNNCPISFSTPTSSTIPPPPPPMINMTMTMSPPFQLSTPPMNPMNPMNPMTMPPPTPPPLTSESFQFYSNTPSTPPKTTLLSMKRAYGLY